MGEALTQHLENAPRAFDGELSWLNQKTLAPPNHPLTIQGGALIIGLAARLISSSRS